MIDVTKQVKQFVRKQDMDLVGIASTARLRDLTPAGYNHPEDLLRSLTEEQPDIAAGAWFLTLDPIAYE